MTKWKSYKLEELIDKKRGISYGIVQPGVFLDEGGVPVLKVNNLTEKKTSEKNLFRVTKEIESKFSRTRLQGNEILVSLVGSIGHVHKVSEEQIGWNVVRAIGVLPIKEGINKDWVYWCLKSPDIQALLINNAVTTVQSTLNIKELKEIEIPYPGSTSLQQQIVSILSSLDDKIELNLQMNQTLEAIAQAVFKEWFVNFNFPDFDGELLDGLPNGWRIEKLGKILDTVLGGTPSTTNKEFWENGTIPWVNSGKVNEFRIIEPTALITELALKKSNTKLLPKGTTVIAITGATLGQVSRLEIDACANQSVVGILENTSINSEYIYLWTISNINEIIKGATGGAQQHINKNDINNVDFIVPAQRALEEFKEAINPLFHKININCFENRTLTQIRDRLLPKLMTGKIEIQA